LHGQMSQVQRETSLSNFKAGKVNVLVATDLASRGIHITGLPYVVNYTFPPSIELYIHRIGRTGREEESGYAYSFFTKNFQPSIGKASCQFASGMRSKGGSKLADVMQ